MNHRKRAKPEKREEPGVLDVRPWTYPENWHRDPSRPKEKPKDSLDPSIVTPPPYDKFQVLSSSNLARTRSN